MFIEAIEWLIRRREKPKTSRPSFREPTQEELEGARTQSIATRPELTLDEQLTGALASETGQPVVLEINSDGTTNLLVQAKPQK